MQREEGRVTVVYLDGELGLPELAEVSEELLRLASAGRARVVLDLSGVPHLDYRGVRALAARAQLLRRQGGDLKLSGLSPYLEAIVRAAGAHSMVERFASAGEAQRAFGRMGAGAPERPFASVA